MRKSYDRERMARRVKSLRADKGWNQKRLAEESGVTLDTIVSVETARRGIGLDIAVALADAIECPLDQMVCLDERRPSAA